eukprot:CAMPEP_0119363564 /NCGR_PEP_ID=MMETSP1334-20130426/10466_1 /TAXON_ID=127549 /ORGANISM="Calcidiscus leptoporus, Strain RCC1130" /LENGTH=387 /DNA_ID=CAMNT_0007379045 /DNA_START=90 /DNA_END=1253 /DNA_ORIENTATION=-
MSLAAARRNAVKQPKKPFKLHEKIGAGGYGSVYRATMKTSGEAVAVKLVDLNAVRKIERIGTNSRKVLMREVTIQAQCKHPHIVQLLWHAMAGETLTIVLELLRGPELHDILRCRGALSEADARHIFKQLGIAIEYLHSLHIVHRDIKPENVMLREELPDLLKSDLAGCHVKLLDFGLARQIVLKQPLENHGAKLSTESEVAPESSTASNKAASCTLTPNKSGRRRVSFLEMSPVGTKDYAPKEILLVDAHELDESEPGLPVVRIPVEHVPLIDAYQLGRLLRFMLTGTLPAQSFLVDTDAAGDCGCFCFGDSTKKTKAKAGAANRPKPIILPLADLSTGGRSLVRALTEHNAEERLSVGAALRHEWLLRAVSSQHEPSSSDLLNSL